MKYAYQLVLGFVLLTVVGAALVPRLSVQLAPAQGGRQLTVSYGWRGLRPRLWSGR
jgi:hypothetical protein